jgi:hypothetical protein
LDHPCRCHTACGSNTCCWNIICRISSGGSSINGSSGACISNMLGESALAGLLFSARLGLCQFTIDGVGTALASVGVAFRK